MCVNLQILTLCKILYEYISSFDTPRMCLFVFLSLDYYYQIFFSSFTGSGLIDSNGGNGGGKDAGGGAAGRIALYTTRYSYRGDYQTYGGTSPNGNHGGPGTLFVQTMHSFQSYTTLRIDNLMRSLHDTVVLDETGMDTYHFSEVQIWKRASLTIANRNQSTVLRMDKLVGDRTGLIHAKRNHIVFLEASKTAHSVSKPAVNLRIDHGGEMVFGASLYIIGDGARNTGEILGDSSFTINGRMTDAANIVISKALKVRFAEHAHSSDIIDNKPVISNVGEFVLAKLEIQDGAELLFNHSSGMKCVVGIIHMKYGSKTISDRYNISVTSLLMESGSTVTASGDTRPTPSVGPTIPGSCLGSGGSYGSHGGKGNCYLIFIIL